MAKKQKVDVPFTIEDLFGCNEPDQVDSVPAPEPQLPAPPEPESPPSPPFEWPADIIHPIGLREPIPPRPPYVIDWRALEIGPLGAPYTLDCGHMNFFPNDAHVEAQRAGFCCDGGRRKRLIHWQMLRGPYLRPLPVSARRTRDKTEDRSTNRGFPGYCCDDQGWYIGGLANDCRHFRPDGAPLCTAHRPSQPAPHEPEPEWDEDDLSTPVQEPASAGMSWKQRQLEARKRGKGRKR